MRGRELKLLLASLMMTVGATIALAEPVAPPISGMVSHLQTPIAGALVICYNLADTTLTRSRTAEDGTFVLASAPVGVYDLVAYKKGFLPALVRLWHQGLPDAVSAVRIQLAARGSAAADKPSNSAWELRDRLPADVLREISLEEETANAPAFDRLRLDRIIAGEVRSVANVSSGDTSLSRTAVGVRGGLPNGWSYDLRGDYAAVSSNSGAPPDLAAAIGNSAGLALDVATSPDDHVSLSTRRHTLSFHDDNPASLQAHNVSWSRAGAEGNLESLAARYVEETNLYRATSVGTSFFPLASRTLEVKGRYARAASDTPGVNVAMAYRHREGTIGPSGVGVDGSFFLTAPDADLSASSSVRVGSAAEVEGGVVARYLAGGYGVAPVLAARYDLGGGVYLFVRGLYRVAETAPRVGTVLPLVASIEESGEAASRKGFSGGFERKNGEGGAFRVELSNQRINETVRAFFEGDFLTDFDSVYLFDGNTIRQYQLNGSRRLSETVSGSFAVRYGSIGGEVAPGSASTFGVSNSGGRFWSARAAVEVVPTHTGLALLVRGVRQRLGSAAARHSNDSDKVALSVAQDLSVIGVTPFGSVCKLLVALESGRSTAALDTEDQRLSRRVLGGLAISF